MVDIRNLTKIYKGRTEPAVYNVSLSIASGEIFGLLGPNGAGKTTILSILSGLIKPTSGEFTIKGLNGHGEFGEIKKIIGVVSQEIALYDRLTAFENLFYFGTLYNIEKYTLRTTIDSLLKRLSLYKYRNEKIRTFSGGMKRRINLLAGLLHFPQLLFLDEPVVGVDIQTRKVINEFLFELRDKGTTMIYTSHLMDDAEKLCDTVAIIDYGKIISEGRPGELIKDNSDCNSLEDVFIKFTGRKLRDE
jgi:ABC-2 type transport system ATP-binding protein